VLSRRRLTPRRLRRWLRGGVDLAGLLRLSRDDHDELAWQARRRLDSGRPEEAERLFELLGRLWPRSAALARLGQGVCRQALGDLPGAEAAYDDVLRAEPENLHALANRAEVRLLARRPSEARSDLAAARALLDRSPPDLRARVETLEQQAAFE
jgi:tetratricopeptide (TPR) repeat protein